MSLVCLEAMVSPLAELRDMLKHVFRPHPFSNCIGSSPDSSQLSCRPLFAKSEQAPFHISGAGICRLCSCYVAIYTSTMRCQLQRHLSQNSFPNFGKRFRNIEMPVCCMLSHLRRRAVMCSLKPSDRLLLHEPPKHEFCVGVLHCWTRSAHCKNSQHSLARIAAWAQGCTCQLPSPAQPEGASALVWLCCYESFAA